MYKVPLAYFHNHHLDIRLLCIIRHAVYVCRWRDSAVLCPGRNSKMADKPIDLRTGTVGSACPCNAKYVCLAFLLAAVVAGAVLAFYFIRHGV